MIMNFDCTQNNNNKHLWCSGNISAFQALALDSISGRCKSLFTFYYSFTMKDLFDTLLQVFDGTCLMSHGYLVIMQTFDFTFSIRSQ